jgi:chemotaxis protein methyltransferase CheR
LSEEKVVTWSHPAFAAVADALGRRTGLRFSPSREASAEQGLRRAMARAGVSDPNAYLGILETREQALDELVDELTVGETWFFREPGQLAFIRREVLPGLRRLRGESSPRPRCWSAGCSSGEEAYTLAILMAEEGIDEAWVLGTDISRAALARAKRACYTSWSLRGEGALHAPPYLLRRGSGWEVVEQIRRRVTFNSLNLALDVYPSFTAGAWGMDVILCRNVLIYFHPDAMRAAARRLFASLAPGGWLFTASSDPPLGPYAPFECVMADEGVFYRRPVGPVYDLSLPRGERAEPNDQTREEKPPEEKSQVAALADEPNRQVEPSSFVSGIVLTGAERGATEPVPCTGSVPGSLVARRPLAAWAEHGLGAADPVQAATEALARGDYVGALELTVPLRQDPGAAALRVRALANLDLGRAEEEGREAVGRHPLRAELHFLHATVLLGMGKFAEAGEAIRRALYLDRSLAAAHCVLGAILERSGDPAGARRAYRNARDLCAARPPDEEAPLADGESTGRLLEASRARLAILGDTG